MGLGRKAKDRSSRVTEKIKPETATLTSPQAKVRRLIHLARSLDRITESSRFSAVLAGISTRDWFAHDYLHRQIVSASQWGRSGPASFRVHLAIADIKTGTPALCCILSGHPVDIDAFQIVI